MGSFSPCAWPIYSCVFCDREGTLCGDPFPLKGVGFMPSYTTGDIRNVLLAGHGGSGKTTLADAMLFASGSATRKGSTADGTSVSDFEKEEKEHKHSIFAS